jgi:RimJ/RimL family protein N-acetyltransferase
MAVEDLEIRYSEMEDGHKLYEWLQERENAKWFPMLGERELQMLVRNWAGYFQHRSSLTGLIDHKVCAVGTLFLMPYQKVSHHASFSLIVDKAYRSRGVGFSMVKNLLHLAKNFFHLEGVCVEVFEGCPILPLLEKFSFSQYAHQAGFVKEEDGSFRARILLEHFFDEVPK